MDEIELTLNDIASSLRSLVRDLECRSSLLDIYDYQQLFIGLNFLILPIIAAFGVCFFKYGSTSNSDTAEVLYHTLLVLMMYLSASVGVPLYLSSLWAVLSAKLDHPRNGIAEDLDFFDAFDASFDLPLQLSNENFHYHADENAIDRDEADDEWDTIASHSRSLAEDALPSGNQVALISTEIVDPYSLNDTIFGPRGSQSKNSLSSGNLTTPESSEIEDSYSL